MGIRHSFSGGGVKATAERKRPHIYVHYRNGEYRYNNPLTPSRLDGRCLMKRNTLVSFKNLSLTANFHRTEIKIIIIIIIIIFNISTAAFKAYCAIWVRRSNFRHQASPRVSPCESIQRRKVEMWARKCPGILPKCHLPRYI